MHSERPMHRMYEQWHPLGNVGIISALVLLWQWAWNAFIAAVCGNIYLASSKTTSAIVSNICSEV